MNDVQVVVVSDSEFATWLDRELRRLEWSQADFARRMGIGTGAVAMWVNGTRNPSPKSVDHIADVLGVDRDYLLALAKHRSLTQKIDPESATARLMPLIERVDWASRPGRIEEMEAELRQMLEFDRKQREGRR